MKLLLPLALAVGLTGCGDFVDADGNTSIRQFAEGLQSLGGKVAEMGEALQRDAGVRAVPWQDLMEVIPDEVDGAGRVDAEGDDATDRNGAGLSIAQADYLVRGDSMYVGVADLGALRSGVGLALRWVAPLFANREVDGEVEEIEVRGYPAIRIRDEEGRGHLVVLLVENRFAVIAGGEGSGHDDFVRAALADIDYDRLERWRQYGH